MNYAIALPLRYKSNGKEGTGKTLHLSSKELRFSTTTDLIVGRPIQIRMDWPARLNGTVALQLVMDARVRQIGPSTATVSIARYQFRTKGICREEEVA